VYYEEGRRDTSGKRGRGEEERGRERGREIVRERGRETEGEEEAM
jgi:hypothetical protein